MEFLNGLVRVMNRLRVQDDERCKTYVSRISDGIIINERTKTIEYVEQPDDKQSYVDTSVNNNPYKPITLKGFPDVKVYSIFRRLKTNNKKHDDDGSPLIYALKGEEWEFKSDDDYMAIMDCMEKIIAKFFQDKSYKTTVVLPSSNSLNDEFAALVKRIDRNTYIISDLIKKFTVEDVLFYVKKKNSPFHKKYRTDEDFADALDELEGYCEKMIEEKNGYFAYHYVHNSDMRNLITECLKIKRDDVAKYVNNINDADILLIDDSMSRGQTVRNAITKIQKFYKPHSISVLTLFSKLY